MIDVLLYIRVSLTRERGQTMAEYAVVLTVIAIGTFVALGVLGGSIKGVLGSVASKI